MLELELPVRRKNNDSIMRRLQTKAESAPMTSYPSFFKLKKLLNHFCFIFQNFLLHLLACIECFSFSFIFFASAHFSLSKFYLKVEHFLFRRNQFQIEIRNLLPFTLEFIYHNCLLHHFYSIGISIYSHKLSCILHISIKQEQCP